MFFFYEVLRKAANLKHIAFVVSFKVDDAAFFVVVVVLQLANKEDDVK